MTSKFLNEGCFFKCSNCATVKLKPVEVSSHRTNFEGKKALTTSTQLQLVTTGICPSLPCNSGSPNCIFHIISGSWIKFSKHMAGDKNLLLDSSEFVCEIGGGKITVDTNAVKKEFQEMYSVKL